MLVVVPIWLESERGTFTLPTESVTYGTELSVSEILGKKEPSRH
jgi:hypothetical protein